MATKKPKPSSLARIRRMSAEYEEPEYNFEPTEQPEPEAKSHHFAVNPSFREQDIDELEQDVEITVVDPGENADLVPFVRQQVGLRMLHWHSGQGDPIYAVGSFYCDGDPYPRLDVMVAAESRLDTLWNQSKSRTEDKKELGIILNWLRWEIAQAQSVNNNPEERGYGRAEVLEMLEAAVREGWSLRGTKSRLDAPAVAEEILSQNK